MLILAPHSCLEEVPAECLRLLALDLRQPSDPDGAGLRKLPAARILWMRRRAGAICNYNDLTLTPHELTYPPPLLTLHL